MFVTLEHLFEHRTALLLSHRHSNTRSSGGYYVIVTVIPCDLAGGKVGKPDTSRQLRRVCEMSLLATHPRPQATPNRHHPKPAMSTPPHPPNPGSAITRTPLQKKSESPPPRTRAVGILHVGSAKGRDLGSNPPPDTHTPSRRGRTTLTIHGLSPCPGGPPVLGRTRRES